MKNKVLLDTNLTVLFVIGSANPNYIQHSKRLQAYDKIDYKILIGLLSSVEDIIFCPNVLTETSNLLGRGRDLRHSEIMDMFVTIVQNANENYIESRSAILNIAHSRLGLTDAVLLTLAETGATLLTADSALYVAAKSANLNAVNYFHIKELREDFQ